jgi:signal transduction histidine kinase
MGIIILVLAAACAVCLLCIWKMRREREKVSREDQVKTEFIRNMSHEIRTPLHTVSGLAEIIADESLYLSKDEKKNISDQIKSNAAMISTMLDEVMRYVDVSATGHPLEDERISPNRLCLRCIEAFGQQYAKVFSEAKIVFKRTLDDDYFINTDPHIVQLILNKLIANACRFTQKGEVAVGCSSTENPDKLTIYVQDTGSGIPEDRKASLFNWFEHPEASKDPAEMDLSIAYRLAQHLGGVVAIDPMYQQGTRMLLILPLR